MQSKLNAWLDCHVLPVNMDVATNICTENMVVIAVLGLINIAYYCGFHLRAGAQVLKLLLLFIEW